MKYITFLIIGTFLLAAGAVQPAYARDKTAEELIAEGDRLYSEGKYEEATEVYDEAYSLAGEAEPAVNVSPAASKIPAPAIEDVIDDAIIKEADRLFKAGRYFEAAEAYDRAYEFYKSSSEEAAEKGAQHRERLEELKALRQEGQVREEALRLKDEYINELEERRQQDKLKRRAELHAESALKKKLAAQRHQAVREERKRYKQARIDKRARIIAERKAMIESREREREERRARELARRELREVPAAGAPPDELAEFERHDRLAMAESMREAKVEAEKRAAPEMPDEKRLAKKTAKERRRREKERLRRERLERIEEAMFQKRQAKLDKKRLKYKADAVKKATRCKKELDRYAIPPIIDQRRLEKAAQLTDRADSYYERDMFKEAGKLYDRAYLTLRGKLH